MPMTSPKAAIIAGAPSSSWSLRLCVQEVLVRISRHGDLVLHLTVEPNAEVGLESQPGLAAIGLEQPCRKRIRVSDRLHLVGRVERDIVDRDRLAGEPD